MIDFLEKFPVLFPLFFIVVWVLALFQLSQRSGWRALANHYARREVDGNVRRFQSLSIRSLYHTPIDLSGVVTFRANDSGIGLSLLLPWRPFHSPLFFNYAELQGTESKRLIQRVVELRAMNAPDVKISITINLADWIESQSGGAWSYQRL